MSSPRANNEEHCLLSQAPHPNTEDRAKEKVYMDFMVPTIAPEKEGR